MKIGTLEDLKGFVRAYIVLNINDSETEFLRHSTYDAFYEKSGEVFYSDMGRLVFSTLKKISADAINDTKYPFEKAELLLRLYYLGCTNLHDRGYDSHPLNEFCDEHTAYLKKWQSATLDNIYKEEETIKLLHPFIRDKIERPQLSERLKYNQEIFFGFYEFIQTKNPIYSEQYRSGNVKLSMSNSQFLIDHYNIRIPL
ncbi:hypothetical protein [Belliella aquatica]|uniref:Uncharacterized protein n=1 Tax=Belliella aquatica TaxID=1323734 RepID=A0ABQ1N4E8_9BACT|nr:hypothetical protein [Belliella aquatica]MCH7407389.1 hypothetical protein [Belliella aquatica]GGC53313.1 hypothetical protein GCM10010993_34700 [Belliella aquatica]